MILITCIDDNMGMAFNNRRQSRDRTVTARILEITAGKTLWTDRYSSVLFEDRSACIVADDECPARAGDGEFCFIERQDPVPYLHRVEKIILFHWNRKYPSSLKLNINLDEWEKISSWDFSGYSHEEITEEVYIRR